jgi:hypothetical protein
VDVSLTTMRPDFRTRCRGALRLLLSMPIPKAQKCGLASGLTQ